MGKTQNFWCDSVRFRGGDMLFLFPVDEDLGDDWDEDNEEEGGGGGADTPLTADIKSPQTPGQYFEKN